MWVSITTHEARSCVMEVIHLMRTGMFSFKKMVNII